MTGIFLFLHPLVLKLLNIPAQAEAAANTYTMIYIIGIPLIVGYNTVCAILRGMGAAGGCHLHSSSPENQFIYADYIHY